MKKALILAALSFLGFSAMQAQTVGDVPIKNIDVAYLQINVSAPLKKAIVTLDFGQSTKLLALKSVLVKDEKGETVVFNSLIDAVNFFANYGFRLVSVNTIDSITSTCVMENTNFKPAKASEAAKK
ncbi:MAG: hypothetical protein LBU90_09645 [Bacteroidales bacterium]|jgi:hypothetical protein|nr:hypothetical protein [Bacteroidales bacterium]